MEQPVSNTTRRRAFVGGGTATLTIPKAGTYKIHCKIHASMHGTITVA